MLDVGIFGCSFTASNWPDAWPFFFAKKYSEEFNVFDYSVPGSSVEYSIYRLKEFKKQYPHGKTIFQITTPHRVTKILGNTNKIPVSDNYVRISPKWDDLTVRTMGDVRIKKDKLTKYLEHSIRHEDDYAHEVRWENALFYIQENTDFAYSHKSIQQNNNFTFPCVQDICGKTKFKKYCKAFPYDVHFKRDGAIWTADWIYGQVKQWI